MTLNESVSKLNNQREAMNQMIADQDLATTVFQGSGRRIQDILAHVAYWENAASNSIAAHLKGKVHTLELPLDLDAHNEKVFQTHFDEDSPAVQQLWESTRNRFLTLIQEYSELNTSDSLIYPWGETGTVEDLVEEMAKHEVLHAKQIEDFLSAQQSTS